MVVTPALPNASPELFTVMEPPPVVLTLLPLLIKLVPVTLIPPEPMRMFPLTVVVPVPPLIVPEFAVMDWTVMFWAWLIKNAPMGKLDPTFPRIEILLVPESRVKLKGPPTEALSIELMKVIG